MMNEDSIKGSDEQLNIVKECVVVEFGERKDRAPRTPSMRNRRLDLM